MKLKNICIMATLISFGVCSLVSATPNEKKNIKESPKAISGSSEVKIVFIGNEETEVTKDEYNLLLRVCMSECGGKYGEPLDGKIAVVETILNRSKIYGKTIEEVIYEPHQYSLADNGEPDETVEEAVDVALRENIYPDNMIYFRTGNYHSFGTPYQQIGNHYFSLKGDD
jgi:spore germination cell wall hydrolase CwlJ-like protein